MAAAAIAVVVIVALALVWWTSDARATQSEPAMSSAPTLAAADSVPSSVKQLWAAPSSKTSRPVVVSSTVVTGDGREMVGRDPLTGAQRWRFARDRDLCSISWVYDLAVAAFKDGRGCGQVSTVNASTGKRGPTRTAFADDHVELSTDGTTVLSAGPTKIEMWRSDMVRTLAYGDTDAPINPPVGPNPPCQFLSTAASSSAASVLESCPDQTEIRLTLLRVSKEDVVPDQRFVPQPDLKVDSGAKVLTVSDLTTAVYLPTPDPRVVRYDDTGQITSTTLLPKPPTDGAVSRTGNLVTYWTGDSVVVLDAASLAYRYTIGAGTVTPIGPGEMMADRLLVPVTGGITVLDPTNGGPGPVIPVDRGAVNGPVILGVAGTTIIEQRGDQMVALGAIR